MGNTREIPLTKGYAALVDAEDFERFGHLAWQARIDRSGRVYANRCVKISRTRNNRTIVLHRAILDAPAGLLVDHINRNTLDNRRANLRLATPSQNCCNSGDRNGGNRLGFKGVRGVKGGGFRGVVILHGHFYYTQKVATPEQAARDRDALALRLHGPFAALNFEAVNPFQL